MTRVWLVGARGALGRSVARKLEAAGVPRIETDRELDISSAPTVGELARRERPTHIVNCAAYTQVDQAESDAKRAMAVNGEGPGNLARAAAEVGASLCHVSTDYVFDGCGTAPYSESDVPGPLGIYGRSKRAGELAVLEAMPSASGPARVLVVRTSWLFGEAGPNFVLTMLRLMAARKELRVVADQRGCPTYTRDLAAALLALCGLLPGHSQPAQSGIYHFSNSVPTTWHGFAEAIRTGAEARGWQLAVESILPITTAEYPTPAKRPSYSVLDTSKISNSLGDTPRPWMLALSDYLDTLKPPFD